jgi:nickel transport protein
MRHTTGAAAACRAATGLCAAAAALLLCPGQARAHGIQSSVTHLGGAGDQLLLHSAFSSGAPTSDALVSLVPPGGQPMEVGRTDSHGQLSFALPKNASGDWELRVDGGPGHRDYLEMPVRSGQAQLDQLSEHHRAPLGGIVAGLGGLGAAAMLLGLQRIRRTR